MDIHLVLLYLEKNYYDSLLKLCFQRNFRFSNLLALERSRFLQTQKSVRKIALKVTRGKRTVPRERIPRHKLHWKL